MKLLLSTASEDRRRSKALRRVRPVFESLTQQFAGISLRHPIHDAFLVGIVERPSGRHDLAATVSDDFDLICRRALLGVELPFITALEQTYEANPRQHQRVAELGAVGTGAHMNLNEINWRIGPFHNVIVGIDAGLAAIHERLNTEEGFDGSSAREHAEPLFGLGFVAAQSFALGTVSDLNRVRTSCSKAKKEKLDCYARDAIALKGGVTRIQLINATANYFKHHDEWARWPTGSDRGAYDTRVLGSVGINEKTEFPCIDAVDLLCGTSWELVVLHQILKEWREYLFRTLL